MRAEDTTYTLILMTEDGKKYDISDFVTDLGWEETESELSMRLSCTLATDNKKLRSLVKLGCMLFVISSGKEVARGFIQEAEPSLSVSTDQIPITCYDELIALEKSEEQYYFSSGQSTKPVLTKIFADAGIPMGRYTGANVKHGKLAYKSGSIADTVLDILKDAKSKGGAESIVRATEGKIEVLKYGSNTNVYIFDPDDTISMSYKQSITNLVTRVKIVGTSTKKASRPAVVAVMNGMTKFGIRQKIITQSKSSTSGEAQKQAKRELEDNGKPDITITVQAPDVPELRKGDMEYLKIGELDGYYNVKGVKHDAMNGTMTLSLKAKS